MTMKVAEKTNLIIKVHKKPPMVLQTCVHMNYPVLARPKQHIFL